MSNAVVNVLDFGAQGNGVTEDTHAFEKALQFLKEVGGGTLIVNAHKVYLIRPLHISTSHLVFHIQDNATLLGIADARQWHLTDPYPSYGVSGDGWLRHVALFHGNGLQNVTFRGEGYNSVICGNGPYWWNLFEHDELDHTRPNLMEFQYSQELRFDNLRLLDSPFWNWVVFDCDHVHVTHMWIEAVNGPNTDGWDPSSSRHVTIEDSSYNGGDDCIAVKSGLDCFGVWYDTPCEYLHVRNVTCQGNNSASVALGSETSGGIRHVLMEDLHFPGKVKKAIEIKTGSSRGGWIHNVTFQDITVSGTPQHPMIHLDMLEYSEGDTCIYGNTSCRNWGCPNDWEPIRSPPRITNVTIQRMNAVAADMSEWEGEAFHFAALTPDKSVGADMANIVLENIFFPPTASWSCQGPVHNVRATNVFPGPPCFEPTTQQQQRRQRITLDATTTLETTRQDERIQATEPYWFLFSIATLLAIVVFLFSKRVLFRVV